MGIKVRAKARADNIVVSYSLLVLGGRLLVGDISIINKSWRKPELFSHGW